MSRLVNVLVHEHQYGVTVYPFDTEDAIDGSQLEDVAEKLGIDFEEHKGETLHLDSIDLDNIPKLQL